MILNHFEVYHGVPSSPARIGKRGRWFFRAKLLCPFSANIISSSYIDFNTWSLGMLIIPSQYFTSWSCCLRCSGNCPVSPYTARSGVLWRTLKTIFRYFSWTRSRSSIGFTWYQILEAYYKIATVRKRPIWVKIVDFLAVWPWNLTNDLEKQQDTSSKQHQALCIIS